MFVSQKNETVEKMMKSMPSLMKRECITLATIAEANPYESPSLKGKRLHSKMNGLVGY